MANAGITSHRPTSEALYDRACQLFPGGVNSPVRAFKAVGGTPVFLHSGSGAHVQDIDGNRYLDFVCSWGPLIFGHADPDVVAAIVAAASSGTSFGASTLREIDLAERIRLAVPSI
jgi:glutamate-1-semialdehyde 2,1-aminomutase